MLLYKKCYFLFIIGGVGYSIIEILWRGHTHPSMGILGGLCLIAIWLINTGFSKHPLLLRALFCSVVITILELLTGILLNIVLELRIWSYSERFLNFMGQICPFYSMLWFCLSYVIIFLIEKSPAVFYTKKERG